MVGLSLGASGSDRRDMSPNVVFRRLLFVLAASLLPALVSAQTTATVSQNAPIYIRAETMPTPLRVAAPGTRLRVLSESQDWLQVEFSDPQFGPRVGWTQREFVTMNGDATQKPLDLSYDTQAPKPAAGAGNAQPTASRGDMASPFPKRETAIGWSTLHVTDPLVDLDVTSTLGWNVSVNTNLSKWIGVVGDIGGHYKSDFLGADVDAMEHTFMGGPRFAYRDVPVVAPYAQMLFGLVRRDATIFDEHVGANDFAIQPGGGVDVGTRNIASRFELGWRKVYSDVSSYNEFRMVIGIVFRSSQ
jgi:hypothetical protein